MAQFHHRVLIRGRQECQNQRAIADPVLLAVTVEEGATCIGMQAGHGLPGTSGGNQPCHTWTLGF